MGLVNVLIASCPLITCSGKFPCMTKAHLEYEDEVYVMYHATCPKCGSVFHVQLEKADMHKAKKRSPLRVIQ